MTNLTKQRGFTLMELMVVVVLVAMLTVMAMPSMSRARLDRIALSNATRISQLVRTARTRAISRGAAVMVAMASNGATNRGQYMSFEAVAPNPTGSGANRLPFNQCTGTHWGTDLTASTGPLPGVFGRLLFEGLDLNGQIEADAKIETVINGVAANQVFMCFTPGGRAYFNGTTWNFDAQVPLTSVQVQVRRVAGGTPFGTTRTILIPPSGVARLVSQ